MEMIQVHLILLDEHSKPYFIRSNFLYQLNGKEIHGVPVGTMFSPIGDIVLEQGTLKDSIVYCFEGDGTFSDSNMTFDEYKEACKL